ncbi:MAG TPA: BamA/TamA family outer membrane protein [Vicinamibacterales bacterium]|nr:BamA/TamA family outer membrane protein [Vicinamibacterales bacterium]
MPGTADTHEARNQHTRLDRALAVFADVQPGEGLTALLMLVNIFVLLICYSVIKTVREPLILLGGGAEVRSYAAAGQALLLMGFVPLYSLIASRLERMKLIVGVTLFFVACIELFAVAVAARVPYIGVAFFIWVGIFNMSLVAQFWSFANDIYRKDVGSRIFPVIMIGMTAGAPLGSIVAARLFHAGLTPQVILQLSALLLTLSAGLYLVINRRAVRGNVAPVEPLAAGGGFALVLANPYLRMVAALVVLLNIVNTTGEYIVARMLTAHVSELAAMTPGFNKQAFIGAFSGEYQFWVNVTALLLQAFVTSRLVKFRGLQGALLALPLIALGGYALIAAGVGFSVVRWVKTAENGTDYSIMNTARQLLWLPTSREEKYKAKQAIDTFFVRAGDVVSALVVFTGTSILHLAPSQFAMVNVVLTLVWIGVAMRLLAPSRPRPRLVVPRVAGAGAAAAVLLLVVSQPASAQESRADALAARRAEKAANLKPYEPTPLERRVNFVTQRMLTKRTVFPFVGGVLEGGGIAVGPGFRRTFGDTGLVTGHAAWSLRSYGVATASVQLPEFGNGRLRVELHGERLHAPTVAFFGIGNGSSRADRRTFGYDSTTLGGAATLAVTRTLTVGGGLDYLATDTDTASDTSRLQLTAVAPAYRRATAFAEVDTRDAPGYTRSGGLVRASFADYRQVNGRGFGFQRADGEVQRFVPLVGDNQVIALRATASATLAGRGETVPFFLLPELGGHHALRGYSSWRFRDRDRVLLSGEYRWAAGPLVDMSLFADAGAVAARLDDLSRQTLRTSYGIGFSVHTPNATVTRLELARSREGLALLVSFGPSF